MRQHLRTPEIPAAFRENRGSPPRVCRAVSTDEAWATAIAWVGDNLRVIAAVASPFRHHLPFDKDDIAQEATLVAFGAILRLARRGALDDFAPYFFSAWRTVVSVAGHGVPVVDDADVAAVPDPRGSASPLEAIIAAEDEAASEVTRNSLEDRLALLTRRQRHVCTALLDPSTRSLRELAAAWRCRPQKLQRLVKNSLRRLTAPQLAAG